jgi:tetratricopeptide (TPR) repeat protein
MRAYRHANKDREVINSATQLIKVNPASGEAYERRGWAEYNLQEQGAALSDMRMAIALGRKTSDAYLILGECLVERHQYQEALAFLEKSQQADPSRTYAIRQVGELYTEMHQYSKAEQYYQKAISLQPKEYDNFLSLGHCHFAAGQYQKAINDYSKAIELNPLDARNYGYRATVYKKLNQTDKYQADITRANASAAALQQ